jgi:hypothetical protein
MDTFTPEERAAIMATARATLERLENDQQYVPRGETRNQRDRRLFTEQEAEREREREHRMTDAQAARLKHWLFNLVDEQKTFLIEVVGEALAQFKEQLIEELEDRINTEVGKLRADVHVQRAVDEGTVNVLPNVLTRKPG